LHNLAGRVAAHCVYDFDGKALGGAEEREVIVPAQARRADAK